MKKSVKASTSPPVARKVTPPRDLDDVALAKWSEMAVDDAWGPALSHSTRDFLAEYCRLESRRARAESRVLEHGELVASPNGFPTQSPWLQIVNKCRADMLKISGIFSGALSGAAIKVPATRRVAANGKKEQQQATASKMATGKFATPGGPRLVVNN